MASTTNYRDFALLDGRYCRVRLATGRDRAAVISNINAVAAEQRYLPVHAYAPTALWEHALNGGDGNGCTYLLAVAETDSRVVGHLRLFPGGYGHADQHVLDVGIVLCKECRGLGIGARLLDFASDWANSAGYTKLTGSILSNNFRAIRLFLNSGYRVEGRRFRQFRMNGLVLDEILVGRLL